MKFEDSIDHCEYFVDADTQTAGDLVEFESSAWKNELSLSADGLPKNAYLIGFRCGFDPLFVLVYASFSDTFDEMEAEEAAIEYLQEIGWLSVDRDSADYVITR